MELNAIAVLTGAIRLTGKGFLQNPSTCRRTCALRPRASSNRKGEEEEMEALKGLLDGVRELEKA